MTYLDSIPKAAKLTRESETLLFTDLSAAIRRGDGESERLILEKVLSHFFHWAAFLATRNTWGVVSEEEAHSLAADALMRVARNFNPTAGIRFCTYAKHRIIGLAKSNVIRELERNDGRIHYVEEKYKDDPVDGGDSIQFRKCIRVPRVHQSPVDPEGGHLDAEWVMGELKRFDERTRDIVVCFYIKNMTLREIAARIGRSHERVRQILNQTIKIIREKDDTSIHQQRMAKAGDGSGPVVGRPLRSSESKRLPRGMSSAPEANRGDQNRAGREAGQVRGE